MEEEKLGKVSVNFVSNEGLLDMLLGTPIGLLSLLDEESRFPAATGVVMK